MTRKMRIFSRSSKNNKSSVQPANNRTGGITTVDQFAGWLPHDKGLSWWSYLGLAGCWNSLRANDRSMLIMISGVNCVPFLLFTDAISASPFAGGLHCGAPCDIANSIRTIYYAGQISGHRRQLEVLIDPVQPPIHCLSNPANRLAPAESTSKNRRLARLQQNWIGFWQEWDWDTFVFQSHSWNLTGSAMSSTGYFLCWRSNDRVEWVIRAGLLPSRKCDAMRLSKCKWWLARCHSSNRCWKWSRLLWTTTRYGDVPAGMQRIELVTIWPRQNCMDFGVETHILRGLTLSADLLLMKYLD